MEKLSWKAPEFIPHKKGPDWYWAVGVITITLAVTAIVFGNVLFAIVILAGSFTLTLQASRDPEVISFEIDDEGVQAGRTLYPYSSLKSFWVENNPHEQKILLQSEKVWMPYIVLPITNIDPEDVRDYLSEYLPEEEHQEPFLQKVMEYLGF